MGVSSGQGMTIGLVILGIVAIWAACIGIWVLVVARREKFQEAKEYDGNLKEYDGNLKKKSMVEDYNAQSDVRAVKHRREDLQKVLESLNNARSPYSSLTREANFGKFANAGPAQSASILRHVSPPPGQVVDYQEGRRRPQSIPPLWTPQRQPVVGYETRSLSSRAPGPASPRSSGARIAASGTPITFFSKGGQQRY